MNEHGTQRFVHFLRNHTDDQLRVVMTLTPDDYRLVYLRENLRDHYDEAMFRENIDAFRLDSTPFDEPPVDDPPVGPRHAILHYHDNATIAQLPYDSPTTVIISIDKHAITSPREFIDTCCDHIDALRTDT